MINLNRYLCAIFFYFTITFYNVLQCSFKYHVYKTWKEIQNFQINFSPQDTDGLINVY